MVQHVKSLKKTLIIKFHVIHILKNSRKVITLLVMGEIYIKARYERRPIDCNCAIIQSLSSKQTSFWRTLISLLSYQPPRRRAADQWVEWAFIIDSLSISTMITMAPPINVLLAARPLRKVSIMCRMGGQWNNSRQIMKL